MNIVTSDYPPDTKQSYDEWLAQWAEMEKARMKAQQAVKLDTTGRTIKTVEQYAHIWCPDSDVESTIKKIKEEGYNGKARREGNKA